MDVQQGTTFPSFCSEFLCVIEIKTVNTKIEKVEKQIEDVEKKWEEASSQEEKQFYKDKLDRLGKKEAQLHEEKLILLKGQQPQGLSPFFGKHKSNENQIL